MKPARARFPQNVLPIKVTRAKLAGGGIAAVWNSQRSPDPEPAFGKVKSISHRATNAVVRNPFNESRIHTALKHEILDQAPDVIVGKLSTNSGAQSKTAPHPARHIVLPASFPYFKFPCRPHPPLARIKPQHDLTQRHQIILARTRRLDFNTAHTER